MLASADEASSRAGPVKTACAFVRDVLGRPLGLIHSLMALIGDPVYEYCSKGFESQLNPNP